MPQLMCRYCLLICYVLVVFVEVRAQERPYVVIVSFDGLRYDQPDLFQALNFISFREKGSYARGLIPSFPSKTFPNHYSLATGLYPGNHGLVDNSFFDPSKEEYYTMKSRSALINPYFYGGVPLWKLAAEHHVKSASFFWVGSEIPDEGRHPDYYYPYDESVPFSNRVEQVLSWLKLPDEDRPHLIMLYFSSPDHEAHEYGPVAEETKRAVLKMDSLLGQLMNGIKSIDLPVNVILVSDHGMAEVDVKENTFIYLDELIPRESKSVTVVNGGSQVHCYVKDKSKIDSVYRVLKSCVRNADVLKEKEFPKQWKYQHERCGDILLVAHPQFYFQGKRPAFEEKGRRIGVHGYDPAAVRDMWGIFYAQGPQIKPGRKLRAFENVHVYPLIAQILQLPLPPIDGEFRVLKPIYQKALNE